MDFYQLLGQILFSGFGEVVKKYHYDWKGVLWTKLDGEAMEELFYDWNCHYSRYYDVSRVTIWPFRRTLRNVRFLLTMFDCGQNTWFCPKTGKTWPVRQSDRFRLIGTKPNYYGEKVSA